MKYMLGAEQECIVFTLLAKQKFVKFTLTAEQECIVFTLMVIKHS
jgi:hypothetical protein